MAVVLAQEDNALPRAQGNSGDVALNLFIRRLANLWRELLGQPLALKYDPTAHPKGAEADSPAVRFVAAVLEKLQITDKDGDARTYLAIRKRILRAVAADSEQMTKSKPV
jgi:hypothetical protein